jgi:DNA sulfur modification protein DndB
MEDHAYSFAAIRGVQAGREYYVIMCPFKLIPKIFVFDEEGIELSPELRSQRTLNKARIPEMASYIVENPQEYCFSAITASVDCDVKFKPLREDELGRNVGKVEIGMSSTLIINDGQHRRAAIEEALKMNPSMGAEKICVVLFVDRGLERSQQMFADLNKHAVRPSRSLGVLYDHRDPLSDLSRKVMMEIEVFRDMIELEKTSISNRSRKLFTLNSLYNANSSLLGKNKKSKIVTKKEEKICIEFWQETIKHFKDWQDAKDRKINSSELRRDYIHSHGVLLHALGSVGNSLLANHEKTWKEKLKKLQNIDWSRKNTDMWEGRAMSGGRMNASPTNLILTSAGIKKELGVALNSQEAELEKKFR